MKKLTKQQIEKVAKELSHKQVNYNYALDNLHLNENTHSLELKDENGKLIFNMCLEDVKKNY